MDIFRSLSTHTASFLRESYLTVFRSLEHFFVAYKLRSAL